MKTLYYDMTTAYRWKGNPTGIARVVEKIGIELQNYNHLFSDIIYVVFKDNNWFYNYDLVEKKVNDLVSFKAGSVLFSAGNNWDFHGYNKALKEVKKKGVCISILFYDLIPLKMPYAFGEGFGKIYNDWFDETLSFLDMAYAISEHTKNDIKEYSIRKKTEVEPLKVVRLGDNVPAGSKSNSCSKILSLSNYILTVGSIELRKNHIVLLNAYRLLVAEGNLDLPMLLIVGREGFLNNNIAYQVKNDPILKDRVKVLVDVTDDELDLLYRNCLFTLYPALYEGWGLPIAESLMYGKQCVCSNTSSMVEIAPNLTRFCHPLKVEEWSKNILELYSCPDVLKNESNKIVSHYKTTTWKETAAQIVDGLVEN